MVFQIFLLPEILLTLTLLKYFSLVWQSSLRQKISFLLIIVPGFIKTFFVEIICEPMSKHYHFLERFSHKDIVFKT